MPHANPKSKLCLMLNMISPARIPLYSALADRFDLLILHGGAEANRAGWQAAERALPNARVRRVWGWQLPRIRRQRGTAPAAVFDRQFTHISPGCLGHLLRFRPDAVIANEMGLRTLIALAYGSLFRKPVWVWWGGTLHTERSAGRIRRALRRLISHRARHWISYGRTSTEYLRSIGVPAQRILEIQNAVDERRFAAPTAPAFLIRPRPVLLHVGQLIARKGIELLLHSAAALQREGLEFSLLIVGGGPSRQSLQRLAVSLGLKNVRFEPSQPPERMPAVYRSADALIFPTLEDVWGLVANEAILSGLPVLCSCYAGCAYELFPPESIVDPADSEEFKAKLRLAVQGHLPPPDPSRLRTTPQLAAALIHAVEASLARPAEIVRHAPVGVSDRS